MRKKKISIRMATTLTGTVLTFVSAAVLMTACMSGEPAAQVSSKENVSVSSEVSATTVSVPTITASSDTSSEAAVSSQAPPSSKEQVSSVPEKKVEPNGKKEQSVSTDAVLEVKGDTQKQEPPASKPAKPSSPKDGDTKTENGENYFYDAGIGEWIWDNGRASTEEEAVEGNDEFIANYVCPFCGAGFGQCDCKNGY